MSKLTLTSEQCPAAEGQEGARPSARRCSATCRAAELRVARRQQINAARQPAAITAAAAGPAPWLEAIADMRKLMLVLPI